MIDEYERHDDHRGDHHPEIGRIEWRQAALIVSTYRHLPRPRLILSGGLTPENVAQSIAIVKPYGVDVNSGVEASPGTKDPDKVRRFVAAARSASRESA